MEDGALPVHEPFGSASARRLDALRRVIARFELHSLDSALAAAAELLEEDAPIDVALIGQFKSGKSSLLNAIIGAELLPVGVLPVTTVVTRVRGGEVLRATVTRVDGSVERVAATSVAEYVSEQENPSNAKGVAGVDIETPALLDLPGVRLVDTPGLGSVHAHNTRSTMDWLPRVALAIVAMSVERPLSEEDRRLVAALRPLVSRIVVALTKVDLVTAPELQQVRRFVELELRSTLAMPGGSEPMIVPFSTRQNRERHVAALRGGVLAQVSRHTYSERATALGHKLAHLTRAARAYLHVSLQSAEKVGIERDALRAAVLDESVHESVIAKEFALASGSVIGIARSSFESALTTHAEPIADRIVESLHGMSTWRGHLGTQVAQYRAFMRERMVAELSPLAADAASAGAGLLDDASLRLRRVAVAFRDRLSRNVARSLGVELSPVEWAPPRVRVVAPQVAIGPTFMTHWDLLWWLLPMPLIGGIFRRHCRRKVPWDVWVNLQRLAGSWADATAHAIEVTRREALTWVHAELETLVTVLSKPCDEADDIRAALAELGLVDRRE